MKLRDFGIGILIALFVGWLVLLEYAPSQNPNRADLELIEALEADA